VFNNSFNDPSFPSFLSKNNEKFLNSTSSLKLTLDEAQNEYYNLFGNSYPSTYDPSPDSFTPLQSPEPPKTHVQGFYVSQLPVQGFETFLAAISFNKPQMDDTELDQPRQHYTFSFGVQDPKLLLPPFHEMSIQVVQIYPTYLHIVTDTISNPSGVLTPIKLETRSFELESNHAYRANIHITFLPESIQKEYSLDLGLPLYFLITPAKRLLGDPEEMVGLSPGLMAIYKRAVQSQTQTKFSAYPIIYPIVQPSTGSVYKSYGRLTIPYDASRNTDVFTKFELWVTYQPNPLTPMTDADIFNGESSTITISILGGMSSIAIIFDENINETFDGCYINSVRIQTENVGYVGQSLLLQITSADYKAIYRYNHDLLHIECHSVFYILTPNHSPAVRQSTDIVSYVQVGRLQQSHAYHPRLNELTDTQKEDLLNRWSQIIPISNRQIYSPLPIPLARPYPSMSQFIAIYKSYYKQKDVNIFTTHSPLSLPNYSDLDNHPVNSTNHSNSIDTSIMMPQNKGDNNDPDFPNQDQFKNIYTPDYSPKEIAFDDDKESPDLRLDIAPVGAVEWFHNHKQTSQSREYQVIALTCSFQYTIPTLIAPDGTLADETGYALWKDQFVQKDLPDYKAPRLRIYAPFLQTMYTPDIDGVYRLLFIQISSVQTGYSWVGEIPWDLQVVGFTQWIELDYREILFPPELIKSGRINYDLYVNNPPVIEVTFNTYGAVIQFPKDSQGNFDFTYYPQQCLLEVEHIVVDNLHKTTSEGVSDVDNHKSNFETLQNQTFGSNHKNNQTIGQNISPNILSNNLDPQNAQKNDLDISAPVPTLTPTPTPTPLSSSPNSSRYETFYVTQPIPYYDLWNYRNTGIELIALSSKIPHFRIINHNSEPLHALYFYIGGLFAFPIEHGEGLDGVKITCYSGKNTPQPCAARELKLKPNFFYIQLRSPVIYNLEIKISHKPYSWYKRGKLPQYPLEPLNLFPVISLQVQYPNQSPLIIMNQTVTMSFPYGDSLAPRSSRANRPFEWTLSAKTAKIVAWVCVGVCGLIILVLGGFALYYWYKAQKIIQSDSDDDDDECRYNSRKSFEQTEMSSIMAMSDSATNHHHSHSGIDFSAQYSQNNPLSVLYISNSQSDAGQSDLNHSEAQSDLRYLQITTDGDQLP
jgi:hypothetical protein